MSLPDEILLWLRARDKFSGMMQRAAVPPHCPPIVEPSIMRQLDSAYILRGSTVHINPSFRIKYTLLIELSLYRVIDFSIDRAWGEVTDFIKFATEIRQLYPQ